jgi:tetratricopeptide (TPR) repeat protein
MLHVDRDEAERSEDAGSEQPRRCPGKPADVAAHYAGLLARRDETASFARRFFLALAYRSQWDACLREAEQWARAGLKLFPHDPDLLVVAGSAIEEAATLTTGTPTVESAALTARQREAARVAALDRRASYVKARALYEDAVAAADRPIARVRLGRVLWRLEESDAARSELERAVLPGVSDPRLLYLAYLFLGRVHEDAGRLDRALEQYRVALDLDPSAQAAAVALSHALRDAGDAEESRRVLRAALAQAGRRPRRDAFWDYPIGDAGRYEELFADLRREALR